VEWFGFGSCEQLTFRTRIEGCGLGDLAQLRARQGALAQCLLGRGKVDQTLSGFEGALRLPRRTTLQIGQETGRGAVTLRLPVAGLGDARCEQCLACGHQAFEVTEVVIERCRIASGQEPGIEVGQQ